MAVAPGLGLRPAGPADGVFLRALHHDLRREEFVALGLSPGALERLLDMQHVAQDGAYRASHPRGDFDMVMLGDAPVGRLYVDRTGPSVHVVDITLAREHRGRGHGTALLRALQQEAEGARRAVTLEVLRDGRARRLYERLGFAVVAEDEVRAAMRWIAPAG